MWYIMVYQKLQKPADRLGMAGLKMLKLVYANKAIK